MWFIKLTKAAPFESVEVFCKDLFLALYFSISSLLTVEFTRINFICNVLSFKPAVFPYNLDTQFIMSCY